MNTLPLPLAIGSYTHNGSSHPGAGITIAEFDPQTGLLEARYTHDGVLNPSYLDHHQNRLYAVSENFNSPGAIVCLTLTPTALVEQWRTTSKGLATCHLSVNVDSGVVYAASYIDGKLTCVDAASGDPLTHHAYQGSGPNPDRQKSSHAHQAMVTPDGRFLLVPDLGSDCVWRHELTKGVPTGNPTALPLPPGTGPRHLLFHPQLSLAYVLGELDGSIHPISWTDAESPPLSPISIAPENWTRPHGCSALRLHPGKPLLYAAHRGSETIAILELQENGELVPVDRLPTDGKEPRDFIISPDGNWLLVACQKSHHITIHQLNDQGRSEGYTHSPCATPACVHWLE
ncbi:MAG: beta-propeller fold lactonase family protein [Kiritimatiellae bacterium]|jgi:6-phosphogluconolactonase|nr:beta-propeller fold lactonase family protein [Kiritimatiellia bacterium]